MKYTDIIEHLEEANLEVRWIQKLWFGKCDYERDTITLNIASWVVKLLIHEVAHRHWPDKSEKEVGRYEDLILEGLTKEQIEYLFHYVMQHV